MVLEKDCSGGSSSTSVVQEGRGTYDTSLANGKLMAHRSENHVSIDLDDEMIVKEDCGGGSTSNSEAQQGGDTDYTCLADANIKDDKSGNHINIGVGNGTSQTPIADTNKLDSANEDVCGVKIEAPRVGMEFGSWEEIDIYYRQYGSQQGFGVTRASSALFERNKDQKRNMTWRCECAGKPDRRQRHRRQGVRIAIGTDVSAGDLNSLLRVGNPRKSKKCECTAMIYAKFQPSKSWLVSKVVLEHTNHNPNPSKWRDIEQCKKVFPDLKRRKFFQKEAGLYSMVPQVHNYLANEEGTFHNMSARGTDMIDVMGEENRLKLKGRDAHAILKFFTRMHNSSQNFFHFTRHDDNGCIKDVLWVDARSKATYEEFGDVVYFDTTCLMNQYDLPLVNFVGINHHGQTILFGCALVSLDGVETFEWVFKTWLLCVGGRAPQVILTDQATTMRKALATTMPETMHIWCLWNIVQKFTKNLGLLPRYQEFNVELKYILCNAHTAEDFERDWTSVIVKYQLQKNEWLQCLFNERHMWVPAYTNHLFLAGFRPARKLERIQGVFDGFVEKHTTICEFVEGYCYAMEKKVRMEEDADVECSRFLRGLATCFVVESVFQKIYTDAKFREVQIECQGLLYCRNRGDKTVSESEVEHVIEDRVWAEVPGQSNIISTNERRSYRVRYNSMTKKVSCDCKLFEHCGIMCRHSISVHDFYDVSIVPENYILRRWRKDIHRKHTRIKVAYYDPSSTQEVKRYHKMQVAFEDVSTEAMEYDKTLDIVMQLIAEMKLRVAECLGKQSVGSFTSLVECNDVAPNETMSSVGTQEESNDWETLVQNGSRFLGDK